MDKGCHSSGESTTTSANSSTGTNNRDDHQYSQQLRHLSKISHKISKPIRRPPTFDHHHHPPPQHPPPPPPPPPPQQPQGLQQQQQNQPPVYNINKSDFREVVQKLTGSPAHERFSTPPPIQPPKPPSSRLQRIRPPPLAQISNRPPPLLNNAPLAQISGRPPGPLNNVMPPPNSSITASGRPSAPLSPLPPLPAVHAAAESPISAYMRYLQGSISAADSDPKRFPGLSPLSPLVSPRWSNFAQPPQNHQPTLPLQPQNPIPSNASASFQIPTSPLPFGCLPSPRSPYPLLSPSLLFSPSTAGQLGFQQFPVSPTLPVPSPRWKNH